MRPLIKCPRCEGEGRGSEMEWRKVYSDHVEERMGEIAEYDHYKEIYDSLSLTEEEKEAVRRFLD